MDTPAPHPFVSVIVPVYDDLVRLPHCLNALDRQSYSARRFEIIVVDNNARPTVELPPGSYRRSKVVHESRPGSYAARNRGIRSARGEILAFTDSDCVPDKDWIRNGVDTLHDDPQVGLLGGRIEIFAHDPLRPTSAEHYELCISLKQHNFVTRHQFAATANLFTYRRVFEDVGPFNDRFYSCGDVEWGRRVLAAGYQQRYADRPFVRHPARDTIRSLAKKYRRKMGGYHELAKLTNRGSLAVASNFTNSPLKNYFRLRRHGELSGLRRSVQFLLVDSILIAALAGESLRLRLGGAPRRT